MYLKYYKLRREPFGLTPDPDFFYLSPSHKEAVAAIVYGVQKRKGFVAVTGEVGTGKTTVLREVLARANRKIVKPIYVFHADLSFTALLKTVFRELGTTVESDDPHDMVRKLHEVLVDEYRRGNVVVLIIDECQNMPVTTLENLRMLSNLETTKDKLVQIVLVGQPEFIKKLDLYKLRQLKQRIAIRVAINALTRDESRAYVGHRISKATRARAPLFTEGALNRIVRHAKGNPRIINILCDNSLVAGYGCQVKPVNKAIVSEVIADFEGRKQRRGVFWRAAGLVGLVGAAAALIVTLPLQAWSRSRGAATPQTHVQMQSRDEVQGNRLSAQRGRAGGQTEGRTRSRCRWWWSG